MHNVIVDRKDEIVMKLVHYFVTEENYTPVIVNGVQNEVWLENGEAFYKIIRINSGYIHNIEQMNFDLYKTKKIIKQIKRKTLSFSVNAINILLDVNEDVNTIDDKRVKSLVIKNVRDIKSLKGLGSIFPNIKNSHLNNEKGLDLLLDVTKDINETTAKKNIKYEEVFRKKVPYVTYVLIGLNIFVFILTYFLYFISKGNINLYNMFAVDAALIRSGQYYRLITGMFLHAGPFYLPLHLLFNMYALFVIGSQVEGFIGKAKYIIVYLASGLIGSLLSCVILKGSSIGASGAIFGLMGSLTYFGYHYRVYFGSVIKTQIIPLICFNLLLGFYLNGVDNMAHIGGLIGGIISTMGVGVKDKSKTSERINGAIVYVLLTVFLVYMLFR